MEKEFVTYEQALALKELGFDEDCFAGYDTFGDLWIGYNSTDGIEFNPSYYNKAPLKQQVFKFFREKYGWHTNLSLWDGIDYVFDIYSATEVIDSSITYDTYEKAENACIDKLIEIANSQNDINVPLLKQ